MKISLLLMRYLYLNKRLRLPGLGIFTLDKNSVIPLETDNLGQMPNGAQFQRVAVPAADPELIQFISENTGKIRPLATADLESFLGLGIEMLNIGKPFLLEGIGTITRQPTGKFEFAPGHFGLMPVEVPEKNPKKPGQTRKEPDAGTTPGDGRPGAAMAGNHLFIRIAAILLGVVIIGGGGYALYRHHGTAAGNSDSVAVAGLMTPDLRPETAPVTTTAETPAPPLEPVIKTSDSAELRFVILSTPNKAHALRRYKQLQGFDLKPRLFQKDSAWFKIYFSFPVKLKDTVHIKDSLRRQYDANVSIDR